MATGAAPSLACTHHPAIDPVADAWDRLVPRDEPHLRSGFLRAAERSGIIGQPDYLLLSRDGRPVAVAVSYTLVIDTPAGKKPLRVCGSPIGNSACGVHFDPALPAAERRPAFARIAQEVQQAGGPEPTYFFKEFSDEAVAEYANELEQLGFFPVDPTPGTRLALRWPSFEEYMGALRTKYRHQLKKDLKAGEGLEFALLDSFADLAPLATKLYLNVVAHAAATLQVADEKFFAAVSDFDQAHLLVARPRGGSDVIGVNLLLFGDAVMHNVYVGFDYEQNKRFRIYFSLFEQSLRLALERGCRMAYFGQTSYDFKARLGANPFTLTAYMKHCVPEEHAALHAAREHIFPKAEDAVPSDVFHAEGEKE
jgi:predicted N-acyltransferase